MVQHTFRRYENKYLISTGQFENLMQVITDHMDPDCYCIGGKAYPIYNIYFDNDGNDVIRHSLSKPYFKEKLRLRSYKEKPEPDDIVFLELKSKCGGLVGKRRAQMTLWQVDEFLAGFSIPEKANYLQNQVLCEIRYFMETHQVKPAVYICYERMAFFERKNPEFRLTFDFSIRTRRENLSFSYGSGGQELLAPNTCLMEIKIADALPLWLTAALSEQKIFSESFSKYGREYQSFKRSDSSSTISEKGLPPVTDLCQEAGTVYDHAAIL